MECVSPILQVAACLWNCTTKTAGCVQDLNKNLNLLAEEMKQLKKIEEDVKTRVKREEEQQMKRTNQVGAWLDRVECREEEVNRTLQEGQDNNQKKCFGICPKNCHSSYKLAKKVAKMFDAVSKLMLQGHFDVVAERLPSAIVDERPTDKTVGLELMLQKVWGCIEDTSVGVIGLYGMGGVGKTTLLNKLNNEFQKKNHAFEAVIWVVVSRQADVGKVQRIICNKLRIADHIWRNKNEDERAAEIFKVLRSKKFVLLLDDIWQRFDILKVGVPLPDDQNGSKVVFTTRSEEVCGQMEAGRAIKVQCLSPKEAVDLFQMKVGEDTLLSHPDIPKLAKVVAEECKGLPLALITVGRAMASRKDPQEWEHAIDVLRSYPAKFSGMVDYVYLLLKFSYDSLHNATLQSCFLYCSLFPEDYNIRIDELVELWLGEGFLDEFDDIHEVRNQANYIIGSLKLACLLEVDELKETVKMHDVIRDMALWVACIGKNDVILVQEGRITKPLKVSKWKEAKRVSLWGPNIRSLSDSPCCSNLVTMLVRDTKLKTLPNDFFESMLTLKVLDLSGNRGLSGLPVGVGQLFNLQYLNMSNTAIRELQVELKKLKRLRCLLLNSTDHLTNFPREVISSLSMLEMFSKLPNQVDFSSGQPLYDEIGLLEELECLEHLSDISVTITNALSVQKLLSSPKLQSCIRVLSLVRCSDLAILSLSPSPGLMGNIQRLTIYQCHSLRELKLHLGVSAPENIISSTSLTSRHEKFLNLRHLYVGSCALSDMSWVVHAPALQTLALVDCDSILEVIGSNNTGYQQDVFSTLTTLELIRLPRLESICRQALLFPCLAQVRVNRCQRLTKLPFHSGSARKSLKHITGERNWWANLQWEDQEVKLAFSSKYVSCML